MASPGTTDLLYLLSNRRGLLTQGAFSNGLGWKGWAGPGRAGRGWPGLAWDVMGFQSTVENPHKISP